MTASWQPLAFRAPATAASIRAGLEPVTGSVAAELDDSAGRLAAVTGQVPVAPNPLAAGATAVQGLRQQLQAFLAASGRFVCVHPYQHPVGDRRGDYAYLTPADAVAALAAKLADPADPPPAGSLGAVVLMIRETTHAAMATSLEAFNAVFPVTGLQLVQRRAAWLAVLEEEKFICPPGPAEPAWRNLDPRRHVAAARLDTALGALLAVAEGYDTENTGPEAELASLMARKAQRVAALDAAWGAFSGGFQGDAGHGLYLEGDAGSIRRQILAIETPAPAYKLTVLACWLAAPGHLSFFREMWGL